jgi:hypothetical protein
VEDFGCVFEFRCQLPHLLHGEQTSSGEASDAGGERDWVHDLEFDAITSIMLKKIYDVGFKGGGDVDSAAQSALRVALQCVSASPIGLLLPCYAPKWEVIFLDNMFSNSRTPFYCQI